MFQPTNKVILRSRGKRIPRLPSRLDVSHDTTVNELYKEIAQVLQLSVSRIRIAQLGCEQYLSSGSDDIVSPNTEYQIRDLGPQIDWRTVYILEYLGPLLSHPCIYLVAANYHSPNIAQTLVCCMVTAHYVRRELESIFLHKFSADTMPLRNLFKNSFHYWILGGVNLAFWSYWSPQKTTASSLIVAGSALYIWGQAWNFNVHLYLARLREANPRERLMPKGHGFGFVTCPNYLAELITWVGVWLVTGCSWSGALFAVVSAWQMLSWARSKELKYRKQFGEHYKEKKWSMIPGIR